MNSLDPLPEDYVYASTVTPEEVINLRSASGWDGSGNTIEFWQEVIDESLASVGVRDNNGILVGVGFLSAGSNYAELNELVVDPLHRGRGIGAAILHRRINIADESGLTLYTQLLPTNRLRPHYEELGFVATGYLYTRAARRSTILGTAI